MRRLETEDMRVYYAERDREVALRAAARFEACVAELEKHARVKNRASREKLVVVLPRLPLNNAYVQPAVLGLEHISVVPPFMTSDVFALLGLPPEPATVGCHEMAHYIQVRQLSGIPNVLEAIFGYTVTPQLGLESWFWEGVATFYETRMQGGVGRLGSTFWNGQFAAGVADEGIGESEVNDATRRVPWGGNYLVGSHFVDWLVQEFGEDKLWDVVERQSDELAIPLGVSGRFRNAYGRSLSALYKDFVRAMTKRHPKRHRPKEQTKLRTLDQYARYAVARDGTEAIVEQGIDTPARLHVIAPNGEEILERNLTDLLPGRDLLTPSALTTSGLSFTADGKHLYWIALDQGRTFQVSRLVHVDLVTKELSIVEPDLRGAGGSIAPDGSRFYYSRVRGDRWELAAYDLATKASLGLAEWGPRTFAMGPRVSPDGTKIALTFVTPEGMEVRVVDAATGRPLTTVAGPPGPKLEPSWVDDTTLLYVAEAGGRAQIHRASLGEAKWVRVSDAPYLAFAPAARSGRIRVLNREGWHWTLDEIELPASPLATLAPRPVSHARTTAHAPVDQKIDVVSDEPYSSTDHLFVPTLRGPSLVAIARLTSAIGMGFSGGDRLGFHRWAIEGSWDFAAKEPSASFTYLNGHLAPVTVALALQRLGTKENVLFTTPTGEVERSYIRKETVGALAIARTFWTTTVTSGFRYDQLDDATALPTIDLAPRTRRAAGPHASVTYAAAESTPGAGARRALIMSASGSAFPGLTSNAFGDARAAITIVRPLPLYRRHTITFGARGRALPGEPEGRPLLQVGGNPGSTTLGTGLEKDESEVGGLPPTLRFQEGLRGFEDLGLFGNKVLLGDVTYRLPILFDAGTISTITILPSLMLRQIDLELFGSGATLLDGRTAAAAGSALIGRFKLWIVPFGLGIQVARRLTQDEEFTFSFAGGS